MNKLLKICNIKTYKEAYAVACTGADFIGLHYISDSDKSRVDTYKQIIASYRAGMITATPVLVTKEKNLKLLTEEIDSTETPAVQLHYSCSNENLKYLKAKYKESLVTFQVCTPEEKNIKVEGDYLLVDSSYLGGSGCNYDIQSWIDGNNELTKRNKIFIAGGVNSKILKQSKNNKYISGFDIQSFVRDERSRKLDQLRISEVASLLDKTPIRQDYSIGYSPKSGDTYYKNGLYDFLHIDFFDKKYDKEFPYNKVIRWLQGDDQLRQYDYHILLNTEESLEEVEAFLNENNVNLEKRYYHINAATFGMYKHKVDALLSIAIDVKDVINDILDIEKILINKRNVILSLQSERHPDRAENARLAYIILKNNVPDLKIIFDRGVDHDLVYGLNAGQYSIVSGRYLRDTEAYLRLRRLMLYEKL